MRLGYRIGIISVLCAFLLMSHNVSALDATINLNDYEEVPVAIGSQLYDYQFANPSASCSQALTCRFPWGSSLVTARTHNTYSLKKGDIVTYNIYFYNSDSTSISLEMRPLVPGANVSLLYAHQINNVTLNNSVAPGFGGHNVSYAYEIALKYGLDGTYPLGSFNANQVDFVWNASLNSSTTSDFTVAVTGFRIFRYKGSSVNQEQSQATQDASNNSQSAANNNSTSQQTTNLIGAFQSFVTALTNLNATNCNVTLAWPASLGGSMQVNICQNKDYAGNIISVFGSLTLIVFYIPFSLKLLSMIYNEIRSFTNG